MQIKVLSYIITLLLSKIDKGTLAKNPKTLVSATIEFGGRNRLYNAITSLVYYALMQALGVLRL